MFNNIVVFASTLGFGGLLGALAKSFLDKRQLKFSKVFDYKETRYKAIMILMWVTMNPTKYEFSQLAKHRPYIKGGKELDSELNLEYHNAMLFASDEVLRSLKEFLDKKDLECWEKTTRAMKKDLYI